MVSNSMGTVNRRTFLKFAGASGLTATAGCLGFGGSGGSDTIVFGQPAAQTGQWDFLQPGVSQATDVAVEGINSADGPLDSQLEVVRRDTAVNPQEARSVVTQLLDNDDAVALLGLFSSEINPLFNFLQEQQTPIVTPWPGSNFLDTRGGDKGTPENTDDDEWIWRTVISDTVHTAGAAKRALEQNHDTIGVINGTTEGARSWADGFITSYENGGGTVANQVEVSQGESSYQSALDRLFGTEFSAFAVSIPLEDAITLLSDWADGGYGRQPILSDPLSQNELAEQVGGDLNGAWAASPGQSGPNYDTFLEAYEGGGDAELNAWTAPAWDAIQVTALAVERAGEANAEAIERNLGPVTRGDGTEVATFAEGKEALGNDEEIVYRGAATSMSFTNFGNVFGSVSINTAQDGTFTEQEVIPAEDLREFVSEDQY
ncbi:amino acid/amide ABC transporter substrate-binding protein, HAAT family [Haladaptatus litoreus]|uniref:Amino acid/amide ABC transporter substrate-binding protein, HAAT family n=1 Tax=Haladaptatus litoreus TaxID=553468 RepID=A0A1N7CK66_9EURY|nr:ABC transporter substrate-binding protein [Haladaptatus litoreus]SIR64038.1 amino acid/amide ABC transporter substrate-binding protein, HAAT family [Haladaptatus litoreus]